MAAPITPLTSGLGPSFREEAMGENRGHVTEATQLMAGLGIMALDFKPKEPASPPHGDSNKQQSCPRVPGDNAEMSRELA